MWNYKKSDVCGTRGSVKYVELRKYEVCGTNEV
jgi:hypothetical protein